MSPWEVMRAAIQARITEITDSGQWHQEDVIHELQFLLEEIDRLEWGVMNYWLDTAPPVSQWLAARPDDWIDASADDRDPE